MFEKLEKLQLVWLAVILALGLVIAVKAGTRSMSNDKITVTGSAYEIVKSDSARLEFELTARTPDKQSAYNKAKVQMPVVMKYLEEKGITDIEVQSASGYDVYRYNANGSSTGEVLYHNFSQPIIIKSNDVQKIKDISVDIQGLLDKGIDIRVMRPEFFYSQLADLKIKLLQEATTDAKDRATAMLKATHNRPGKIQSVQMGVFQITPVDSTNVSDMGISDTTTVDKKVTAVANIVFRIK